MRSEVLGTQPRCALLSSCAIAALWAVAPWAAAPLHAGANFWTSMGPDGGTVTAVLADPIDAEVAYAATSRGGVFKSTDGGATWQSASRGLTDHGMTSLAADPLHPGTLYATSYSSLAVSHDSAATWSRIVIPKVIPYLWSVAVDPARPDTLYVGTNFTVYVSRDGGGTWTASKAFRRQLVHLVADPVRSSVFALAPSIGSTPYVLEESTDGGVTWVDRSATLPASIGGEQTMLAVEPTSPGRMWLASKDGPHAQTFRSTDGGATWQPQPGGFPVAAGAGGVVVAGLFRSADGGDSWQAAGVLPDAVAALAIGAGSTRVYAGGATVGMMVSADGGGSWQVSTQGLTATFVAGAAIDSSARLYLAVANLGLVTGAESGGGWRSLGPGFPVDPFPHYAILLVDPGAPGTLYFRGPATLLSRSTDAGVSWAQLPRPSGECFAVATLTLDASTPSVLYATGELGGPPSCFSAQTVQCTAFKSVDAGATWSCMPSPYALQVVVAPSRPSTLYGVGSFGPGKAYVWKSTNAGATWLPIDPGLPMAGLALPYLPNLVVDPTNPERLFLSVPNGGVWRSVNGGRQWQETDHGLPHSRLPPLLAMDPQNPRLLYAAEFDIGVYRSLNGGRTWQPILAGLPPVYNGSQGGVALYGALLPDPQRSGTVYLATGGRGLLVYSAQ
jgi:photosystem II stability/assembly factor-like uncharacterized protein